ncbi:MAG: DUF3307 domain-containing protein [Desulfurivibrionaceae bacterium]
MIDFSVQLTICLLSAHIFGDFLLQADNDATRKPRSFRILFKHSLVVAALSYLLAGFWQAWSIPVVIFLSHAAIDYLKSLSAGKGFRALMFDQAAHVAVILALVWLIAPVFPGRDTYWMILFGSLFFKALVLAAGFVLAVNGGSVAVNTAVASHLDEMGESASKEGERPGVGRGLQQGGKIIGRLERALIFLFILIETPESLGFLIAAKTIFRFGELKETSQRMETEYIMIGTLWSFVYGIAVAYGTCQVMEWLLP